MKKIRIIKKALSIIVVVTICLSCFIYVVSATDYTYTVSQASSYAVGKGGAYYWANVSYGIGNLFYDANIESHVGVLNNKHFLLEGLLHTPGTSNQYTYYKCTYRILGDSDNVWLSTETPGYDYGVGHARSIRYADSDTNYTNEQYDLYLEITQ